MKKRNLTLLLIVLACFALGSVGFASWVITRPSENKTVDGNITVDTVETDGVTVKSVEFVSSQEGTSAASTEQKSFKFGPNAASSNGWLTAKNSQATENLTVYLKITVKGYSNLDTTEACTVTLSLTDTDGVYQNAKTKNYVGELPSTITLTKSQFSVTSDDEATAVVKVSLTWGSYFNNQNPMDYYKEKNATDVITEHGSAMAIDDAGKALSELESLFSGKTVSFTITVSAKAAAE